MGKVVMLRLRNRSLNRFKPKRSSPIMKKTLKRTLSKKGKTLLIKASPISLFSKNRTKTQRDQK